MNLLENQQSAQAIKQQLKALKAKDIPYNSGRAFALTYVPPTETYDLIKEAYSEFLTENALDPTSFPSLGKLESDIITTALSLMNAPKGAVGTFTFGGTESIFCALKAARNFALGKKGVKKPNIVLPITAHAAFHKACHYMGIEPKVIGVDAERFTAKAVDYEKAIDKNTILFVASAPSYAHGVIDPIEAIAVVARSKNLLFHVDACVGGMYLPFARRMSYSIPQFDFSVDGVTSISMDFHKYGFAAKGASAILFKDAEMRKYQIFSNSSWTGYSIVNPTVMSSKSGGSLAACWAAMQHFGFAGYEKMVKSMQEATQSFVNQLNSLGELKVLGTPSMNMVAFTSVSKEINVFNLTEALKKRGWFVQAQFKNDPSPENIHLSINQNNAHHINDFVTDLKNAIEDVRGKSPSRLLNNPITKFMARNFSTSMFNQMEKMIGAGDGELPDDLSDVNALLNSLPPKTRDAILIEFMNRLLPQI